jgi:hypothetical protein
MSDARICCMARELQSAQPGATWRIAGGAVLEAAFQTSTMRNVTFTGNVATAKKASQGAWSVRGRCSAMHLRLQGHLLRTNRILLALFCMHNRTFFPIWRLLRSASRLYAMALLLANSARDFSVWLVGFAVVCVVPFGRHLRHWQCGSRVSISKCNVSADVFRWGGALHLPCQHL